MRIAALLAAFARASTDGTYIVIPESTTLYTGDSVWTDFELPNLTDSTLNPYVHQITVVEYGSSKSASQMKTTILFLTKKLSRVVAFTSNEKNKPMYNSCMAVYSLNMWIG